MRRMVVVAMLVATLAACGDGPRVVGGKGVEGDFTALVDLKPKSLQRVSVEVHEDFTCPACQRFSLEVLPALKSRYGDALVITVHPVAAPSTQPAAVILHDIAASRGIGDAVATALWQAGLEHRSTDANDERVRAVARRFELEQALQRALSDPQAVAAVRERWLRVAHKVSHFPFVEIEGEIVTNGDRQNLEKIFDSLLRSPP